MNLRIDKYLAHKYGYTQKRYTSKAAVITVTDTNGKKHTRTTASGLWGWHKPVIAAKEVAQDLVNDGKPLKTDKGIYLERCNILSHTIKETTTEVLLKKPTRTYCTTAWGFKSLGVFSVVVFVALVSFFLGKYGLGSGEVVGMVLGIGICQVIAAFFLTILGLAIGDMFDDYTYDDYIKDGGTPAIIVDGE